MKSRRIGQNGDELEGMFYPAHRVGMKVEKLLNAFSGESLCFVEFVDMVWTAIDEVRREGKDYHCPFLDDVCFVIMREVEDKYPSFFQAWGG